jgi:hypothetical protein
MIADRKSILRRLIDVEKRLANVELNVARVQASISWLEHCGHQDLAENTILRYYEKVHATLIAERDHLRDAGSSPSDLKARAYEFDEGKRPRSKPLNPPDHDEAQPLQPAKVSGIAGIYEIRENLTALVEPVIQVAAGDGELHRMVVEDIRREEPDNAH